jgi:hypothetical protein
MNRSAVRILLPLLSLIFIATAPRAHAVGPKGDAFVGYSRTGDDTFYPGAGALNGWEAALHVHLHYPFLGAEGDVAEYGVGANSSIPRTTTYLFGPRATLSVARVHLFAHALVGGEHSASSSGASVSGNALTFAVGGGLDVPILPFFAWRFAGDFISAPTQSPEGGTPGRFSTGLVFRF